jgi:hypothetical protein
MYLRNREGVGEEITTSGSGPATKKTELNITLQKEEGSKVI